jgi:hypothetical protein
MNYFIDNKTDNKTYTFNKKDIEAIRQLREEKYSTSDWIFNASYLK